MRAVSGLAHANTVRNGTVRGKIAPVRHDWTHVPNGTELLPSCAHSCAHRDFEIWKLAPEELQHAPCKSLYRFNIPDCCSCGTSGNDGCPRTPSYGSDPCL